MSCNGNCNCQNKRCYSCKFYVEKRKKGLFGSTFKYWVCDNPKTIYQSGDIWWNDGKQIALLEGNIGELLVGCNFGCVNWEKKEDE